MKPEFILVVHCVPRVIHFLAIHIKIVIVQDMTLCSLVSKHKRFEGTNWLIFRARVPLSLVRIIEELFQGNSGSGLENRD
jgi:hypothetical protein